MWLWLGPGPAVTRCLRPQQMPPRMSSAPSAGPCSGPPLPRGREGLVPTGHQQGPWDLRLTPISELSSRGCCALGRGQTLGPSSEGTPRGGSEASTEQGPRKASAETADSACSRLQGQMASVITAGLQLSPPTAACKRVGAAACPWKLPEGHRPPGACRGGSATRVGAQSGAAAAVTVMDDKQGGQCHPPLGCGLQDTRGPGVQGA